jgi:hypothetical protein
MAQRKETKKKIKARDLKPKKDAKGGFTQQSPTGPTSPTSPKSPTGPSPDMMWFGGLIS